MLGRNRRPPLLDWGRVDLVAPRRSISASAPNRHSGVRNRANFTRGFSLSSLDSNQLALDSSYNGSRLHGFSLNPQDYRIRVHCQV